MVLIGKDGIISSSAAEIMKADAKMRWGFAWNNETDQSSNDISSGIGMGTGYGQYSAGDKVNCCATTTGINRSARVEIYIR